jgi:hypothetical protein
MQLHQKLGLSAKDGFQIAPRVPMPGASALEQALQMITR